MTAVISDTSPLNYLIWIGCDHILPRLYGQITIPLIVLRELESPCAPVAVHKWLQHRPQWVGVHDVGAGVDPDLEDLDPGERAAILLAVNQSAGLLLMDERAGVKRARERGLIVTGTLGVLLHASKRGLIDLDTALRDLQTTAFRYTPGLLAEVKRRAWKREV